MSHNPFPTKRYELATNYWNDYINEFSTVLSKISPAQIRECAEEIENTIRADNCIYFCGNGGSLAVAEHFICDFLKGISYDVPEYRPRVLSLSSASIVSAIANDIGYDEIYSYQLKNVGRTGDLLIAISSSGNSKNIANAVIAAKLQNMRVMTITGFNAGMVNHLNVGGPNVYIPSSNYGIVEDATSSVLHAIAQYIRQAASPKVLDQIKL